MPGELIRVSVRQEIKAAVLRLEAKSRGLIDASTVRALNRTATTVRKEAAKQIRERYNIKAKAIKRQLHIIRATRQRLVAEIRASGKRIPLIEFVVGRRTPGARRRGGVKARITKKVVAYRHAFIAQMPNAHIGVFERSGKFGRRGKAKLEKIRQLVGISIPKAMTEKSVNAALARIAAERFKVEFERDLRFRSGG